MAAIDPGADIGHVHLKVADLDRAIDFYRDVLGFDLTQQIGDQAAFLSAGGYHHHIGLNTWESKGGSPPPPGSTGLFHLAIRYPSRASLADALKRLVENNVPLSGASDHGVSEAIYLHDPDGNGIELYRDRPARGVADGSRRQGRGDDVDPARPRSAARRGLVVAKGYAEGPAAEEAERRRDELERGGDTRKTEVRAAVYGSTDDEPERHFIAWRDDVDPDELFASGKAWGLNVVRVRAH